MLITQVSLVLISVSMQIQTCGQ